MRAISLHPDVIVLTSRLLQTNSTIVRGPVSSNGKEREDAPPAGETFLVDSPILPDELALLPSLVEQARFAPPRGLLATHADWDHLLARIAFPDATLGCAETSAARLQSEPGAAQRELRAFDEELYIVRERPLQLGAVQALPVPGTCEIGDFELELHPAEGHTADGMALVAPWAGLVIAGDYLSNVEIPTVGAAGGVERYLATLERLRPLVAGAEHIVPGHGSVLDAPRALEVLEQDALYVQQLRDRGAEASLPRGRRSAAQRELHAANVAVL
ncbi:MAG TPA: MBL fold metallo-hydrolase [Solirubrobacteraceae bacterium]|nr:MBL fold metallo-hydrolase [Solirubrobacteraceae bacterium]